MELIVAYSEHNNKNVLEQAVRLLNSKDMSMLVIFRNVHDDSYDVDDSLPPDRLFVVYSSGGFIQDMVQFTTQLLLPLKIQHVHLICSREYARIGHLVLRHISNRTTAFGLNQVYGEDIYEENDALLKQYEKFKELVTLREMVLWSHFWAKP